MHGARVVAGLKAHALDVTIFLKKRDEIVQTELRVDGSDGTPECDDV